VSVAAGAELGGTGTIVGNVTNSGRIARGESIGNINVTGHVMFSPASTFTVRANAAGTSDRLIVSGASSRATLQGGTVDVQAADGDYQAQTRYTILSAQGGVTGAFGGATSSLAFLTPVLSYDPTNVFLTLARNDLPFESVALSADEAAVGRVFTQLQQHAAGDMAVVLNALTILTPAEARAALESTAAVGRAGVAHVNALGQRVLNQAISARASGSLTRATASPRGAA
jgi:hypothetical protein